MSTVVIIIAGISAGVLSAIFGIGGGVLFIPTLVFAAELSQLHAQATSLAAIIPVVAVGAWRQHGYQNVQWRPGAAIGFASLIGVAAGATVVTELADSVLRKLFAVFLLLVAARLWLSVRDGRRWPTGLSVSSEERKESGT